MPRPNLDKPGYFRFRISNFSFVQQYESYEYTYCDKACVLLLFCV